jgi:O-antigen/teichoic acid export membrane protein
LKIIQVIPKDKIIALGSFASIGARLTNTITLVLATSIAARAMTKEEFGLWTILVSLMYIFMNFDLGFRFGLGNRLAAQVALAGGTTNQKQRELYLSIFFLQIGISILGVFAGFLLSQFISWQSAFKIHQLDLIANTNIIIFSVFTFFLLNLSLSLVGSGFFAYQEVNLYCFLNAGQSIIQLVLFWISTLIFPFIGMLVCFFLIPLLTGIGCTSYFFYRRGWNLTWIPFNVIKKQVQSLANRSLEFFVLSLSATIITAVNTILAGKVAGLSAAGDFDLIKKIFSLLVTSHLALLAPLAPAYTRAAQLGNWAWVRKKFSFCKKIVWPIIFIGGIGVIYIFHPIILKIWSGRNLHDFTLAGLLALTALLSGWGNTQSVLLNSLGLVKWQAIAYLFLAPLFIFLPLYLGKYWGIIGVAAGTLLCTLPGTVIWPIYTRHALRAKLLKI